MRRFIITAAVAALLTGCGGGPPTVQGSIADLMTPANDGCGETASIALTNPAGAILASQLVTSSESDGWCVLPFSFLSVPPLPGYGIRLIGLGGGTVWLTPAQARQFVNLWIAPGFALSGY